MNTLKITPSYVCYVACHGTGVPADDVETALNEEGVDMEVVDRLVKKTQVGGRRSRRLNPEDKQ